MQRPEVFISYSWHPIQNKLKVLKLAERLQFDGVHVIIDEWDLAEGQDKNMFMEQMVNKDTVERVLLICNRDYTEKANSKKGGVGIESLIVSGEIYAQAQQKKFIPIVFERDEKGKELVPTFVNTRIFIDLSNEEIFEAQYEKLLRNIFDKPASRRPPLGTPPQYIIDEAESILVTSHKIASIKRSFLEEKKNTFLLIDEYYDSFIEALNDFMWQDGDLKPGDKADDLVLRKIESLRPLRNDYMLFLEVVSKYSLQFDLEKLHNFWKRVIEFVIESDSESHFPQDQVGYLNFDHFRFFMRKLFLHQTAYFIERENFEAIKFLTDNPYVVYNSKENLTKAYGFQVIRKYLLSLQYRNERLQLNRLSLTADLLKERTSDSKISFEKIREADLILNYIDTFNEEKYASYTNHFWFPETLVSHHNKFPIFEKMRSKKYFNKVIYLFGANSLNEFKTKLLASINREQKSHTHGYNIPKIGLMFRLANLGQLP